jgi:hypothetical protein
MYLQKSLKGFFTSFRRPRAALALALAQSRNPVFHIVFSFLDPGFHRGDDFCDNRQHVVDRMALSV